MTAEMVAPTIVQLAQFALYAYGIHAARQVVMHWLYTREHPVFERRTQTQKKIDQARKKGKPDPTDG